MAPSRRRKTAREKLHIDHKPEVVPVPEKMVARLGPGLLLIPTPLQVDLLIREIPPGHVATTSALRKELARRNGADTTCALCTGIFWRLAAEAAEEDRLEGALSVAPYWRLVRDDGSLNEKLPGGVEAHAALLQSEGLGTREGRGKPKVGLERAFSWA